MLEEGVATRADLLMVEVKLNEAKIMRTKLDNGLTLARMALAQVCGLPVQTEMTLADEDFKTGLTSMPDPVFNMQDVYSRGNQAGYLSSVAERETRHGSDAAESGGGRSI